MRRPGKLFRLIQINYVMARFGLDRVLLSAPQLSTWRFLSKFNPFNWFGRKSRLNRGETLREIFVKLGPTFVKFGQVLSTRPDLVPEDIAEELAKLQDKVPAFSAVAAKKIIETSLKKPIEEVFDVFVDEALASASIAQVHAAKLKTGEEVVVKVLRPNIKKTIKSDIGLLYTAAKFVRFMLPKTRRLHLVEAVEEVEQNLYSELDLLREAANASFLRRNFKGDKRLYVPEIYWDFCTTKAMVMERIHGVSIYETKVLESKHVNMKKLAETGLEIFFTQVFRDSYFHADMHPGNIFVDCSDPENPGYVVVDFGIMGSLSDSDQRYIAENLLAFFNRDYRRVAQLHVQSGWVAASTRIEQFEAEIRAVSEPVFSKPLKDISFANLLLRLLQTASKFEMEIQPQLLLLQKTLLNMEGLGRRLYPELDLWETAKPFLQKWLKRKHHPKRIAKQLLKRSPRWAEQFLELPDLIHARLSDKTPAHPVPQAMPNRLDGRSLVVGVLVTLIAVSVAWII